MKIISFMKFILSLLTLITVLNGCTSVNDKSIPISSESVLGWSNSNNPSLSKPEEGLHPFIGIGYSDKQNDRSSETAERLYSGSIDTGFIYQPSLEETQIVEPFFSLNCAGALVLSSVDVNSTTAAILKENNIDSDDTFYNYKIEAIARPGFIVQHIDEMLLFYFIGLAQYENGEFDSFRNKVDGIANLYNIKDNHFTFGFGLGSEMQYGSIGKWDVGFSVELSLLFNKTQSISYSDQGEDVEAIILVKNGDNYRKTIFKIGPYIDYKNIRISSLWASEAKHTIQVAYRF